MLHDAITKLILKVKLEQKCIDRQFVIKLLLIVFSLNYETLIKGFHFGMVFVEHFKCVS